MPPTTTGTEPDLQCTERDEGEWIFHSSSDQLLSNTYYDLCDELNRSDPDRAGIVEKLENLLTEHPEWLHGRVLKGSTLEEMNLLKEAEIEYRRAYAYGLQNLPARHTGKIEWFTLSNRPFLRSAACLAELLTKDRRYKEATAIMRKLLKWSPNDNLGMRFLLGPALLRDGKLAQAKRHLQRCEAHDPTVLYELSLISIKQDDWFEAGKTLRTAWIHNPYVPELLACGPGNRPRALWMGSNTKDYDGAAAYVKKWGKCWHDHPEALDFLWWLYTLPAIMRERADRLESAERLMWEHDFEKRGRIIQERQEEPTINDETFKMMLSETTNSPNGTDLPWQILRARRTKNDRMTEQLDG